MVEILLAEGANIESITNVFHRVLFHPPFD
jgi:hypothetical protein